MIFYDYYDRIIFVNKTDSFIRYATVAQLVEYDLAKVGVAGSSPVCRSYVRKPQIKIFCKIKDLRLFRSLFYQLAFY